MQLAGVAVEDRFVRDLAAIVDRPLANKLERALLFRAKFVGLTCDERLAILGALEKGSPELQEVRELLLTDETWRLHRPR